MDKFEHTSINDILSKKKELIQRNHHHHDYEELLLYLPCHVHHHHDVLLHGQDELINNLPRIKDQILLAKI